MSSYFGTLVNSSVSEKSVATSLSSCMPVDLRHRSGELLQSKRQLNKNKNRQLEGKLAVDLTGKRLPSFVSPPFRVAAQVMLSLFLPRISLLRLSVLLSTALLDQCQV